MYTRNMRRDGGRLSKPLYIIKQRTFSPQNNEQATLETVERGERAWGVVAVITSQCLWLITQLILSFDSFPQACLLCSSHEKTQLTRTLVHCVNRVLELEQNIDDDDVLD